MIGLVPRMAWVRKAKRAIGAFGCSEIVLERRLGSRTFELTISQDHLYKIFARPPERTHFVTERTCWSTPWAPDNDWEGVANESAISLVNAYSKQEPSAKTHQQR